MLRPSLQPNDGGLLSRRSRKNEEFIDRLWLRLKKQTEI